MAIPALLDMMAIEGAVVTSDATGCQRDITTKKADYILALEANQGTVREDVEIFATEQKANSFEESQVSRHETIDADHGLSETRTRTVIHNVGWLWKRHS